MREGTDVSLIALTSCLQIMREGTDVSLIAFGKLVGYNLKAAEILEKEGISCEVCRQCHPPFR